jgi:hypothetical protein
MLKRQRNRAREKERERETNKQRNQQAKVSQTIERVRKSCEGEILKVKVVRVL